VELRYAGSGKMSRCDVEVVAGQTTVVALGILDLRYEGVPVHGFRAGDERNLLRGRSRAVERRVTIGERLAVFPDDYRISASFFGDLDVEVAPGAVVAPDLA